MMFAAQSTPNSESTEKTISPSVASGWQVHERAEAFALMEELKKRQRPFEKLRLAQAQEEKYRAEAHSVETMMETLDFLALQETALGTIPSAERGVLKEGLQHAVRHTPIEQETPEADEAIQLDDLKKSLLYPSATELPLGDKGFLADLGTIIAHKLTEQLQHKQVIQQTYGLHQMSEDKLVLCKYLQQLLTQVQKLQTENEVLADQLSHYQPVGLGLYKKHSKKV